MAVIQEICINEQNGTEYTKVKFTIVLPKPLTTEQYQWLDDYIKNIIVPNYLVNGK